MVPAQRMDTLAKAMRSPEAFRRQASVENDHVSFAKARMILSTVEFPDSYPHTQSVSGHTFQFPLPPFFLGD